MYEFPLKSAGFRQTLVLTQLMDTRTPRRKPFLLGSPVPDRRKILVVQSESGRELSDSLRQAGYEVVLASDAVGVLTMALRHKPDAVVLGARLAGGGAQIALRRLRSSVHTAGIAILALADHGPERQALLTGGAETCLDLPLDFTELTRALHELLLVRPTITSAPVSILADRDRLAALGKTELLDSEPDEEFDILTRLAARLLHTPVALVSLVDDQRQFFKSQVGLPHPWDKSRQTPLSHSFCQWVVSSDEELSVRDAREHAILRTNGAILDLGVVAYAGVPLSAVTNETIGSFCAIDGKPRDWTNDELATLRDLGQLVNARSALNHARPGGSGADADGAWFLAMARVAARGFVGASRLLARHDDNAEVRSILTGIIERRAHELIEAAEAPPARSAAA